MLAKIATAGQNGQFRTPRHIIQLMVEMTAPDAEGRHLRSRLRHLRLPRRRRRVSARQPSEAVSRRSKPRPLPRGDVPRLRLRQHHAAHRQHEHAAARRREPRHPLPATRWRRSMPARTSATRLVLANPPFAGSLDYETTAKDLLQIVKTKKTELLFLALFLQAAEARRPRGGHRAGRRAVRLLQRAQGAAQDAGRGPEARRHRQAALRRVQALRRRLHRHPALHQDQLRRHRPRLVLRLPGRRLLARRQAHALLPPEKIGAESEARRRTSTRRTTCPISPRAGRSGTEPSASAHAPRRAFCVPKADIAAAGYDLSINRYKEVVHEASEHRPPKEIIAELEGVGKGDRRGAG